MSIQGSEANKNGEEAEGIVRNMFRKYGYRVIPHKPDYISVYGHPAKPDILVKGFPRFEEGLIVEVKRQIKGGSVDEKFLYVCANIKKRFIYPAIVVLSGSGFKRGSVIWLKNQVDGEKFLGVFTTFDDLLTWIRKEGNVEIKRPGKPLKTTTLSFFIEGAE
jgi:hypothetical protein